MWLRSECFRFAPDLEAAYRKSLIRRILLIMWIGLAAGMVAVPAFINNDLLFDPDAMTKTLPIRLGVAAILATAIVGFLYRPIARSPLAIAWITYGLFTSFAGALVLIQANHANGFLVNVAGYVQLMIFVPIVSFSFLQAVTVVTTLAIVGVTGALAFGASQIEVANLANWLGGSAAFALGAAFVVDRVSRRSFVLEQELTREKARADELLLNILPAKIAERLKNKESPIADYCPDVTVLFADIEGFTEMSRTIEPGALVDLLNDLFSRFDHLAETHDVEKIKTIGDGYMAVAGLSKSRTATQAAQAVADLALDMQSVFSDFRQDRHVDLALRIGIHSGPVIAGVIGTQKIAFDLWGDTVNIASRIESCCPSDNIQLTSETRELIGTGYDIAPRGEVEIRGHETRMAYLLGGRKSDAAATV